MKTYEVYTDGSFIKNGNVGAIGVLIKCENEILSKYSKQIKKSTSSGYVELMGIVDGIKTCREIDTEGYIKLYTDNEESFNDICKVLNGEEINDTYVKFIKAFNFIKHCKNFEINYIGGKEKLEIPEHIEVDKLSKNKTKAIKEKRKIAKKENDKKLKKILKNLKGY